MVMRSCWRTMARTATVRGLRFAAKHQTGRWAASPPGCMKTRCWRLRYWEWQLAFALDLYSLRSCRARVIPQAFETLSSSWSLCPEGLSSCFFMRMGALAEEA